MIIKIVAVGKLKERYWQEMAADYVKRLRKYVRLEIIEIRETYLLEKASFAEREKAMNIESLSILEALKNDGSIVVLDRQGEAIDSQVLAKWLEKQILESKKKITFVIGGPFGLSPKVIHHADLVLSFSKLTFPHQMMRIILFEQIYRSFRIIHHEPYSK